VFGRKDKPGVIYGRFIRLKFCSIKCAGAARRNDADSFLRKITKAPSGCWEWDGARNGQGYGTFWLRGRSRFAHRFSYELFNGPIPDGLHILHSCDNPPCVNPKHLRAGTHLENMREARERNRLVVRRGEQHHAAILNGEQVLYIRRSDAPSAHLADQYGVSTSTIQAIRSGQNWGWLNDVSR
jgi:hypothetical protein